MGHFRLTSQARPNQQRQSTKGSQLAVDIRLQTIWDLHTTLQRMNTQATTVTSEQHTCPSVKKPYLAAMIKYRLTSHHHGS